MVLDEEAPRLALGLALGVNGLGGVLSNRLRTSSSRLSGSDFAMKEDLLDADAAVRWAVSNLPSFQDRLNGWINASVEVVIKELPLDPDKDAIIAVEKEPFPRLLNVEAGAYINAIRSSLDILACAIGKRDSVLFPDRICFPVAENAERFERGDYNGSSFVKQLSGTHRKIIKSIKPYGGGNNLLFALHQFDIERKHRRLLFIATRPVSITYGSSKKRDGDIIPLDDYSIPQRSQNETLLAHITKGAKEHDIQLATKIAFYEPTLIPLIPAVETIQLFAKLADSIIKAFDF
jgi:hypothetical protein